MSKFLGCALLLLVVAAAKGKQHSLSKRVLPINKNCDPQNGVCRKGDWIAGNIADCKYDRSLFHPISCDARNDVIQSWTVDTAVGDRCIPTRGLRFNCGEAGTNTRCVCSDYKLPFNECKCQYWPNEDPGISLPAPCTGYYTGGTIGIHHWGCCNNCNDPTNTCDGVSWHGGSSFSYCGACGENTGGGRVKYYFNCGSCSDQQECANYCSGPIRNLPGLCWQWLDCFKGCCLANAQQPSRNKRQIDTMTFCGDGTCSAGESPTTCPIDCCYQINSACAEGSKCDLECCGSPRCCLEESAPASASVITGTTVILVVLVVLATVI